ncbi:hypothetical protein BGZ61DRAFT_209767 [Ilyonectria robusta]|uniref:uncharacterized protein n=1 Tax=Ilyonectria robusta TaxID=1079257 RepID=UPI001E8D5F01|nr:uncharacterized protein BGZ61DRAFT_209767 [Ilyonectria robusta]KAH8714326.1 hypothetical protein BGZ61DRAFT_209767 [Ilyonectria robusta]
MMMTCRPSVTPINNNVLVSPEKRRDQCHGNLATLPKHPALQPRPPHAGNAHTLLRAHHVAAKEKKTGPKNALPVVPYVHAHPLDCPMIRSKKTTRSPGSNTDLSLVQDGGLSWTRPSMPVLTRPVTTQTPSQTESMCELPMPLPVVPVGNL